MGDGQEPDPAGERLAIEAQREGIQNRIRVSGELDLSTAPRLREALREALESDAELVVLDLEALEFIDSTGVQVVVAAKRQTDSDGDRLLIRRPAGPAWRVFRLTGLDKVLRFVAEDRTGWAAESEPGPGSAASKA